MAESILSGWRFYPHSPVRATKPYRGKNVSPNFTYLEKWGWCEIVRYSPETAELLGFSFGVYRLAWGNTFIPWDYLTNEEKKQLWAHYHRLNSQSENGIQ